MNLRTAISNGFVIFFLFAVKPSLANTIAVGRLEKITSIRAGIKAAKPGDTLVIKSGLYKEGNLVIDKPLTISGENNPVLSGENKFEIFTVHAHNVTIKGISFVDTGAGSINDMAAIKVLDSKNILISGNKFNNAFFGIYFANSSESRIENNVLTGQPVTEYQVGNGIHMWKCHHITITNNNVSGHRDGIYFEFVTSSKIAGNISHHNLRYGLHFMFSHDDEYRRNTFAENGAGVAVMYTKGVTMVENTFEHNWGSSSYGLLLKDIRDSEVRGNIFRKNSIGIFMEGSSRIQFKSNTFDSNGYGVRLQASCDGNVFQTNNFLSNTFDIATNGTLVLNTINENYWDRYEGYDLNHDSVGDIPYHPVSVYSMVVERMPTAILLWRSFMVFLLDRTEKAIPVITPENLRDEKPQMKPYDFHRRS
jgi:nitrous oxidase accessory protein